MKSATRDVLPYCRRGRRHAPNDGMTNFACVRGFRERVIPEPSCVLGVRCATPGHWPPFFFGVFMRRESPPSPKAHELSFFFALKALLYRAVLFWRRTSCGPATGSVSPPLPPGSAAYVMNCFRALELPVLGGRCRLFAHLVSRCCSRLPFHWPPSFGRCCFRGWPPAVGGLSASLVSPGCTCFFFAL